MLKRLLLRVFSWFTDPNSLELFEAKFPGKCAICSYHAYGISHCFVRPWEPVSPHEDCPEGMVRWQSASVKQNPQKIG